MFKKGFTLAEVLITLGIIGVVAALTAPALIQSANSAKTGPALSKAVASFENATQLLLQEEGSSSITGLMGNNLSTTGSGSFWDKLSKYLKIVRDDRKSYISYTPYHSNSGSYNPVSGSWTHNAFYSEDKMIYYIIPDYKRSSYAYANIPSNQLIGNVYIDINGAAKPNKQAKDIFRFYLYNDGTLRPYGGKAFDRSRHESDYMYNPHYSWTPHGCNEYNLYHADTCAGSIFDNGMKIIYE